jgi:O-acetyl-ADP-ribose deacetylase (regulator of RNase III)
MIVYRKGDVVEAFKNGEIDVLIHGVNCQGKMNSGIAKQIRTEFSEVFDKYEDQCSAYRDDASLTLLGAVQVIQPVNTLGFIINAFTQHKYGYDKTRFCSYDAIDISMRKIAEKPNGKNLRIGMPKIGAGLGGADWKIVEAIINSVFQDREIYVYELE